MFTTIISKTQIDSEVAHVQNKSESRTRWVDNVSFTVESVRFDCIKLKGHKLQRLCLVCCNYALLFLLNNITFGIRVLLPFNIKSDTNTKLTDGEQL